MKAQNVQQLIQAGALFVVNHSGGKDSQAMMISLLALGVKPSQMLVVHATLGAIEWQGALELAQKQAADAGVPFIVAKAFDKQGNRKTFFDMVRNRRATRPDVPSFPSSEQPQCTSDLKRGPIDREIRRFAKQHGHKLIVSCMGMRAGESCNRAKYPAWKLDKDNSVAGRTWYVWLPIHELSTEQVFATIKAAGQEPHWAYAAGNDRLSCMFCILGSASDLQNAARHNPKLYAAYVALEQETGYNMHQSNKPLMSIVGIPVVKN